MAESSKLTITLVAFGVQIETEQLVLVLVEVRFSRRQYERRMRRGENLNGGVLLKFLDDAKDRGEDRSLPFGMQVRLDLVDDEDDAICRLVLTQGGEPVSVRPKPRRSSKRNSQRVSRPLTTVDKGQFRKASGASGTFWLSSRKTFLGSPHVSGSSGCDRTETALPSIKRIFGDCAGSLVVPFAPVGYQAVAEDSPSFFETIGDVASDGPLARHIVFGGGRRREQKSTGPLVVILWSLWLSPVVSSGVPDGEASIDRRIDDEARHWWTTALDDSRSGT